MKNIRRLISAVAVSAVIITGCGAEKQPVRKEQVKTESETEEQHLEKEEEPYRFVNPEGNTLETRINPPEGYTRTDEKKDSLGEFLRNYKMKPDGSPVLLYNGQETMNQNRHIAVFDLPLENVNLQQCADSIMRVYAEYYRSIGQDEKIAFHFTNGFLASYSKWKQGYRISVNGNKGVRTKT